MANGNLLAPRDIPLDPEETMGVVGRDMSKTNDMAFDAMNQSTDSEVDFVLPGGEITSDVAHTVLPIAGMFPGIGNIADVMDAILYTTEGDKTGAALSLASAIPVFGMFSGIKKATKQLGNMKKANLAHDIDRALNRIDVPGGPEARGFDQIKSTIAKVGIKINSDTGKFVDISGQQLEIPQVQKIIDRQLGTTFSNRALKTVETHSTAAAHNAKLALKTLEDEMQIIRNVKNKKKQDPHLFSKERELTFKPADPTIMAQLKSQPEAIKQILSKFNNSNKVIGAAVNQGFSRQQATDLAIYIESVSPEANSILKSLKNKGFDLDDLYGMGATETLAKSNQAGRVVFEQIMSTAKNITPYQYSKMSPVVRNNLRNIMQDFEKIAKPGSVGDYSQLALRTLRIAYPAVTGDENPFEDPNVQDFLQRNPKLMEGMKYKE